MSKMYNDYVSSLREDKHQQQRSCLLVCVLCTLLCVTILLIGITVGLRYTGSRDVLTYQSTVGDTRLVSYSAPLCSGGEMNVGESPSGYFGNMYFLDDEPSLTGMSFLVLGGTFVINTGLEDYDFYQYGYTSVVYVSWQFHLHPNSVITTRSCVSNGAADFLVIQGNSNYNNWLRRLGSSYAVYDIQLATCGSGANPILTFTTNAEAYYYVVYYASSGSPQITMGLTIDRTEYVTSQAPSCSLDSSGTCTAESSSSTRYILFETGRPNNNTITTVQSFTLRWQCDSKDGVYAAIFFVPLIILALLLCGCFGIFCICGHCRDRH